MDPITSDLVTIHDNILITEMNFEEQVSAGGIIIRTDNGTSEGIRPRWGKVYAIGPDQQDINVGEWILVEHGRWTRGVSIKDPDGNIRTIRRVDNKAILAVCDHLPSDVNIGLSNPSTTQEFDFSQPMY
mgnify:CR=1 FL=1